MYRLAKSRSARQLATEQLPTLVGALLVSELLYKFHSFTLECLAFLATWFVLDGILALMWPRPDWDDAMVPHGSPQQSAPTPRSGTRIAQFLKLDCNP